MADEGELETPHKKVEIKDKDTPPKVSTSRTTFEIKDKDSPPKVSTSRTKFETKDKDTPPKISVSRLKLGITPSAIDLQNARHKGRSKTTFQEDDDDDVANRERKKPLRVVFMEKVRQYCAQADMFATAHIWPIHILCILVATIIIPISAVAVIWDLLSAVVFEIPDLSTINTPAFVLFINFIAIPLAMYGYMMEYLLHEHSRLAIIALVCVIVHPILFAIRAMIEYFFDGYRGEEKIYFESFKKEGQEQKYPIGLIRYRQGEPYSDSDEGHELIRERFGLPEDFQFDD